MPDPKLQTAMEQIKAVLRQHDIAAVVLLSSESQVEYLHEIAPSWSCLRFEPAPEGRQAVRFKALAKDFSSKEAHKKCLQDTIGMVVGFLDALNHSRENYVLIARLIAAEIPFEHITKHEAHLHEGYSVDLNGPSITCLKCGHTSHNPNDVRQKYCGFCKTFHEP
jgi:hypothetical protein